ncbi:regulator of ribonuclease activity B [Striga asiatica]|uniref:Regulator of ribonuclease activity B n=1 Tax=Striga asiatica TaxID=4170 RepID=A0A5A7PUS3_STRAF|nr:regulator of ribonuclease activity B [Striga asiatica]
MGFQKKFSVIDLSTEKNPSSFHWAGGRLLLHDLRLSLHLEGRDLFFALLCRELKMGHDKFLLVMDLIFVSVSVVRDVVKGLKEGVEDFDLLGEIEHADGVLHGFAKFFVTVGFSSVLMVDERRFPTVGEISDGGLHRLPHVAQFSVAEVGGRSDDFMGC